MAELERIGKTPLQWAPKEPLRWNPEIHWEVLYPPRQSETIPPEADNQCLVLRLHCHDWRVMLMADSGFASEKWLLNSGQDLKCDVMVRGAHRSDVGGLLEFMQATRPKIVVVDSANAAAESGWLSWAEERGTKVFDQDEAGAVTLQLRADSIKVHGFLGGQHLIKRAR